MPERKQTYFAYIILKQQRPHLNAIKETEQTFHLNTSAGQGTLI